MPVQRVLTTLDGPESWTVLDENFAVIEPIEAFLVYLSVIERSPTTVRSYAFDLRDYFVYLDGREVEWDSVTLEVLGGFVAWLRLSPAARSGSVTELPTSVPHCSSSTINRKLSALGSFYLFHERNGVDCGHVLSTLKRGARSGAWRPFLAHISSPDTRVKTIKLVSPQRIPRTLDDRQIASILDSCDRLRDRLFITLLITTGIRVGEALGLRHEDIDAAGTTLRVRTRVNSNGARAKSGNRDIPVPASAIRLYTDFLVTEYGDLDCDYVFVNLWAGKIGEPWKYWNVTDVTARLSRRSGVGFTPHMFRHTYATSLLRRGVAAEVVQKLLGHKSITTTTDTYSHLDTDDVRRALENSGWLAGHESASS